MKPAIRWTIMAVVVLTVAGIVVVKSNLKKPDPTGNTVAQVKSGAICDTTTTSKSSCCANGDSSRCCPPSDTLGCATAAEMAADNASVAAKAKPAALPRFLELGSVGCGPCDAMAPILEELRKEYPGQVSVEFFDVKKDIAPARQYGIRVIPTQIFLDAQGKEVFRHEGFFPKEEILPILVKLGVNI